MKGELYEYRVVRIEDLAALIGKRPIQEKADMQDALQTILKAAHPQAHKIIIEYSAVLRGYDCLVFEPEEDA